MKANELMIGNWVYSTFCDKPCKVMGIEQYESEYVNVKVTNVTGAKDINSIYFIPLTAEILEKNGFKKYGDTGWWLEDDFFDIHIYEWSDSIWVFKYESTEMNIPYEQRTFSYVHNLQHALRECGIDKEIVL